MKYYIKTLIVTLIFLNILTSCIVTFYGSSPKQVSNKIVTQKIYWNYFTPEKQVFKKLDNRIHKLMDTNQMKDFLILYQTNCSPMTGKRIYKIQFFKDSVEKKAYLNLTIIQKQEIESLYKNKSFTIRYDSLKKNMTVEQVFDKFPELLKYGFKSTNKYNDEMKFEFYRLEMLFDSNGLLKEWKRINNT